VWSQGSRVGSEERGVKRDESKSTSKSKSTELGVRRGSGGDMKYISGVASLKFDIDKCTGCGRCVEVCPHGVFRMAGRKAEIADRDRCMECGACAMNCEFGALTVNRGVGCAVAFVNAMVRGGEPSCDCGGDEKDGSSCC
jgi:NAD-dependent dihydropyrimidine dehydrogenase PreA subunit